MSMKCPICGSKASKSAIEARLMDFGIAEEHVEKVNGDLRTVVAIGAKVYTSYEVSAEDKLNTERVMKLFEQEHKKLVEERDKLDQKRDELEEKRRELDERKKELEELREGERDTIDKLFEDRLEELEKRNDDLSKKIEKLHELEKAVIPKAVKKELEKIGESLEKDLKDQSEMLRKTVYNVKKKGTKKELEVAKRLRALNTGDKIELKGGRSEEDVLAIVREDGEEMGKVLIESKDTKKFYSKWIKKLKKHTRDANGDVGILVSTAMPKDSLGEDVHYWLDDENILVTTPRALEMVYLAVRSSVITVKRFERNAKKKANMLEKREETIEKIRKVLKNTDFRKPLKKALELRKEYDESIRNLRKKINGKCDKFLVYNDKWADYVQDAIQENKKLQKALED